MHGDRGTAERSGEIYLPYVGHLGPQTLLLEDGSVLAMARLDGVPFELEDHEVRNGRLRTLNTLFRNIADDNIALTTHLVRHRLEATGDETTGEGPGQFRSRFAADLAATYRARVLDGQLFCNRYFLSLIVSPRGALGTGPARQLARWRKRPTNTSGRLGHELEEIWQVLASGLEGFGVHRLGLYEWNGVTFSQIAEALRLLISGQPLRVPLVSGHLGASLYTDRVICGRRGFEIRAPGGSQFGTLFSFREYPAKTRPGMLNALLSAPFPPGAQSDVPVSDASPGP